MKILLIILTVLVFSSTCFAYDKEAIIMQAAVISLLLVDMSQTLYISSHDEYKELNVGLGEHPSKDKVYAYFLGTIVIHTAVSYLIENIPGIENPKKWRRI